MTVRDVALGGRRPSRSLARGVALSFTFAVLTAFGARLKIDLFPVPFTLQVFFVLSAGLTLGGRLGALSQMMYLAMGLVGLPVFAGGGGPLYLLGPTGGYILGFPIAAGLAGSLGERRDDLLGRLLAALGGAAAIHLAGVSWLTVWLGDPGQAWKAGVLIFLGVDAAKACLAALLAGGIVPLLWAPRPLK